MALACALLILTRADGILVLAVCICFIATWRARFRVAALALGAIAPWFIVSWIHLGSLIPDTLLLKINDPWGGATFGNGRGLRLYLNRYPLQTALAFSYLPLALLAWMKSVRKVGAILWVIAGYGLLHYGAYTLLRVGPYHWYYAPEIACTTLLGALAVSALWRELWRSHPFAAGPPLAFALGVPLVGAIFLFASYGVPLRESFVHSNWATPQQYRKVGEWLKDNHGNETGAGRVEIGTLVYYCDCLLLDRFGDRRWVTTELIDSAKKADLRSKLMRVNFLFYKPQPLFPVPTYTLVTQRSFGNVDSNHPNWEISSHWVRTEWIEWIPQ